MARASTCFWACPARQRHCYGLVPCSRTWLTRGCRSTSRPARVGQARQPAGEKSVVYTVQLRLDARQSIALKMAEMREWLDRQQLVPNHFQYRMEPNAHDAAAFTKVFGEPAT